MSNGDSPFVFSRITDTGFVEFFFALIIAANVDFGKTIDTTADGYVVCAQLVCRYSYRQGFVFPF